jgi:hypothetical protein
VFKIIILTNTFYLSLGQVLDGSGECWGSWSQPQWHPRLVEYAGVTGPAYTFDHYAVAPDAVNRDDREFNNKAERVKQELWVSLTIM